MRQNVSDKDFVEPELDAGDHAVVVAANVEDNKPANEIG
jgi:hypothetical protein